MQMNIIQDIFRIETEIRELSKDSLGKLSNITLVDKVIADICQIPGFASIMVASKDSQQVVLEAIRGKKGLVLLKFFSPELHETRAELIDLLEEALSAGLRGDKQSKKAYAYLMDIYRNAVKKYRKLLGNSPKEKYGKFQSLRRFAGLGTLYEYDDDDENDPDELSFGEELWDELNSGISPKTGLFRTKSEKTPIDTHDYSGALKELSMREKYLGHKLTISELRDITASGTEFSNPDDLESDDDIPDDLLGENRMYTQEEVDAMLQAQYRELTDASKEKKHGKSEVLDLDAFIEKAKRVESGEEPHPDEVVTESVETPEVSNEEILKGPVKVSVNASAEELIGLHNNGEDEVEIIDDFDEVSGDPEVVHIIDDEMKDLPEAVPSNKHSEIEEEATLSDDSSEEESVETPEELEESSNASQNFDAIYEDDNHFVAQRREDLLEQNSEFAEMDFEDSEDGDSIEDSKDEEPVASESDEESDAEFSIVEESTTDIIDHQEESRTIDNDEVETADADEEPVTENPSAQEEEVSPDTEISEIDRNIQMLASFAADVSDKLQKVIENSDTKESVIGVKFVDSVANDPYVWLDLVAYVQTSASTELLDAKEDAIQEKLESVFEEILLTHAPNFNAEYPGVNLKSTIIPVVKLCSGNDWDDFDWSHDTLNRTKFGDHTPAGINLTVNARVLSKIHETYTNDTSEDLMSTNDGEDSKYSQVTHNRLVVCGLPSEEDLSSAQLCIAPSTTTMLDEVYDIVVGMYSELSEHATAAGFSSISVESAPVVTNSAYKESIKKSLQDMLFPTYTVNIGYLTKMLNIICGEGVNIDVLSDPNLIQISLGDNGIFRFHIRYNIKITGSIPSEAERESIEELLDTFVDHDNAFNASYYFPLNAVLTRQELVTYLNIDWGEDAEDPTKKAINDYNAQRAGIVSQILNGDDTTGQPTHSVFGI